MHQQKGLPRPLHFKSVFSVFVYKSISKQLQKEMPGLTGFGETSLKDMRTFYEEWHVVVNRQPLADDLAIDERRSQIS